MPRYQACREKLHGPIGSLNKPGGQFRGLDGPLDTGFPSSQSAYIASTRSMNLDHSKSSARTSFGKVSSLRKRLMGLSETMIEVSRYLLK